MDKLIKDKFTHGGNAERFYEIYKKYPLDFSANINPLGMPDCAKKAYLETLDKCSTYPDTENTRLIKAISDFENIDASQIVCGSGAADLIYRIVFALNIKNALLISPTFSEYERALSAKNVTINYHNLVIDNDFILKEDILDKIKGNDILFLCNPNNPTGHLVSEDLLLKIAKRCKEAGAILVIDECFLWFCEGVSSFSKHLDRFENVLVLKAFTKFFAMAGLRLGFCLSANVEFIKKLKLAAQSWAISYPAYECGIAALTDVNFFQNTLKIVYEERDFMRNSLKALGADVFGSDANFIFFKFSDEGLFYKLCEDGILLRDCSNFRGLSGAFLRSAIRGREDNAKLLSAIKKMLGA